MARARLAQFKARETGDWGHNPWLDSWGILLDGPFDDILAVLASTTQEGRDLRRTAPFAGVLTQDERAAALDAFYRKPQVQGRQMATGAGEVPPTNAPPSPRR